MTTFQEINDRYGRRWIISDAGVGAGWYAVRRVSLTTPGLSNVRCGATLQELAQHLAEERQAEEHGHRKDSS